MLCPGEFSGEMDTDDLLNKFERPSLREKFDKELQEIVRESIDALSIPQRNENTSIEASVKKNVQNFLERAISKKPLVLTHIIRL